MADSTVHNKSEVVGSGSLPIESAPGETNDLKTQERDQTVKPANGRGGDTATQAKQEGEQAKMTEADDSESEEKVVKDAVKQISFYLSDSNLPYDRFLFGQAMQDKAGDAGFGCGWIPLSTIFSFKRMQEILSASSRTATISQLAIVNALKADYPSSDKDALLEVSENGEQVRRKKELLPPGQSGQMDRSVYVKGFPEENEDENKSSSKGGKGYTASPLQKELENWFESLGCGRVNAVRMRRDEQKKFKQSVFVEFATVDSVKTFLDLDPKPTYPGQDKEVMAMTKKEYVDMKAKEKGIEKPQYADNRQSSSRDQHGRGSKPFNAFRDWSKDGGDRDRGSRAPKKVHVFVEGKEVEVDQETGKIKNPEEITYLPGKIAKFEGVGDEDVNPMDLKHSLLGIHPPIFVDYERGNSNGVVFFKEPLNDEKFKQIQDANLKLGGGDLTWQQIEGEEEKKYHHERANKRASIALAAAKSSGGGRNGNDRSRGGRVGGRGGDRGRGGRGRGRGGNDRRGGRANDRNEERERNDKKRERDDGDASSPSKAASAATSDAPPAKKAKAEE